MDKKSVGVKVHEGVNVQLVMCFRKTSSRVSQIHPKVFYRVGINDFGIYCTGLEQTNFISLLMIISFSSI